MLNLHSDLRYILRQLRRSPGFALTAILTLALAIGASTAMFSIVQSSLLAPLPYPHANELVGIGFVQPSDSPSDTQIGEAYNFLAANATSYASLGIADGGPLGANLASAGGAPQSIQALRVSSTYLPTLGVMPILGHTFTAAEDLPHAAPTVLLSEKLWRTHFNASTNVTGQIVYINEDSYTVIGVMPAGFATVDSPDVWTPLHLSADDPGFKGTNFQMIARLKSGITPAQAAAELKTLNTALFRQFPSYSRWVPPGAPPLEEHLWPLHEIVVSNTKPALLALTAAVVAVTLLACLNLAGLMTARSIARRSEIALRTALGATRLQTLRLLLTESLILALTGSVLGLGLAYMAVPVLIVTSPIDVTAIRTPELNSTAILFAIVAGCATTLIFGLIPALTVFKQAAGAQIGSVRTAGETISQQRLGKSLLIAQVALATAMLSAGALLLSAFVNLRATPSGIHPQHLYALQVNLKGDAYAKAPHNLQFIARVEERLRQIPGVAQVATVNGLPLDRGLNAGAGPASHKDQIRNSEVRFITTGYLNTVGITLLEGNDFAASDAAGTALVALINEQAAKQWFPGKDPIGEYVIGGGPEPRRVIGITSNTRNASLAAPIRPTLYLPLAQMPDVEFKMMNGWFPTTFVLRTHQHPGAEDSGLARAAEAAIAAADPEVPAARFAPMQSFVDKSVAAPRFFSWFAGAFAVFALGLTLIGCYGLLSYQVASRTRELGVRMALGAQREQILTLVLRNGLVLTSIGLAAGTALSFALRSVISALLVTAVDGLGRPDSVTILGNRTLAITLSATAMLLSTIAASLIPARRAAHLEPTEALRAD